MPQDQYRIPPRHEDADHKLGWLNEAVTQGVSFLMTQRAWRDIDEAYKVILGDDSTLVPSAAPSNIKTNLIKRQVKEIVASLANIREFPGYESNNPKQYLDHAIVLSKLAKNWWFRTYEDRRLREGLQFAGIAGTGYLIPTVHGRSWLTGPQDIELEVRGPKGVIPFMIGPDHDLQKAYAVDIVTEVPLAYAHMLYPQFADIIVADGRQQGLLGKAMAQISRVVSSMWDLVGTGRVKDERSPSYPTVLMHDTYILDPAVNDTGKPIPMGEPGSPWSYIVPSKGSMVPDNQFNSAGQMLYHPASEEECRLYPLRRKLTWTQGCMIRDDTSQWWHGKVPAVQLRLEDWPTEFLGISLAMENKPIQDDLNILYKFISNASKLRLNPPKAANPDASSDASMSWTESFDMESPGETCQMNMMTGEPPIKPLLPFQWYEVSPQILEHIKTMKEDMKYQMGVTDTTALAKARLAGADAMEKWMEALGPLTLDYTRNMEAAISQLGDMIKPLFFEFYDTGRKLQILGTDGVVEEDFDFDPGNMIPSHLPTEDPEQPSKFNRVQRARWHASNFSFHVVPNSIHQITQMSRQLLYLQIAKAKVLPMDWWTLAKVLNIPDFGPFPGSKEEGADPLTVLGRWLYQQGIEHNLAEAMAGIQAGVKPNGRGRPPSGGAPPAIRQKDGGTRSTIAESR